MATTAAALPDSDVLATHLDACHSALASYRAAASDTSEPWQTEQKEALAALRQATQALDRATATPAEQFALVRTGSQRSAVLRLAVAIGLFDHLSATQARNVVQLAERTDSSPEFAHRILRALAALGFLIEGKEEERPRLKGAAAALYDRLTYTLTPLGAYASQAKLQNTALAYLFDTHTAALCSMADYLDRFGRRSLEDGLNCPVVFSQGAKDISYFDQLAKRLDRVDMFTTRMEGMNAVSFEEMAECYDFDRLLLPQGEGGETRDPEDGEREVLIVDVGGGDGRMLRRLRQKFPALGNGRCVVQDLPEVVARGSVEGVEGIAWDFFTGIQPVRGATGYFLQHILHDWPDDSCRKILRNLRPAFSPSSRLLLSEMIMPSTAPSAARCLADINMMVVGGKERTEGQWRELLASAGFKVVAVYGEENGINGIIEALIDSKW